MRNSVYSSFCLAIVFLLALSSTALAKPPSEEVIQLLPKELGGFRLDGVVRPSDVLAREGVLGPTAAGQTLEGDRDYSVAEADYVSGQNSRFLVEVVRFPRDSDAYSILTVTARSARDQARNEVGQITKEVGTASVISPGRIAFFKGRVFVRVTAREPADQDPNNLTTLARLISDRIEKGEADIPVLVKHLPQWEEAQGRVVYLAGFRSLRAVLQDQPILDSVSSEGDADAVAAHYGPTQFILVEYNTPQLAGDNDRTILAKIGELRAQGQPVPSAYRRVGNYSVFVFNAADEQAAKVLIDQVEYEQIVQWLGDNPYMLEKAQREYYETTAGVLVAVVKASGLSLLVCLAAGGFLGALLFNRRRAQQRHAEAFSDAGGMLRLNIDEINPQTDPGKLVGPGTRA
ncbi:MAG: hypothetical protein ND895_18410 [Pyrinomonadaceae bacterium]|nr:hypothetical protein [Pyrinomonadaceae bacterium]